MSRTHKLTLTTGEVALVDLADQCLVSEYCWHRGGTGNRYAVSKINGISVYLHRLILGAGVGDIVDHIDGDPLNCLRSNLRFATRSQNAANREATNNQFGYRGVAFYPKKNKYQARVIRDHGTFRGPYRKTAEAAAQDFDDLARGLFGKFCSFNFPRPGERQVKSKGAP